MGTAIHEELSAVIAFVIAVVDRLSVSSVISRCMFVWLYAVGAPEQHHIDAGHLVSDSLKL